MSDNSAINLVTSTALVYSKSEDKGAKRAIAVFAAMELIKSDLTTSSTGARLQGHMSSLSEYADKIESALNKN
ncbi:MULTISPECIES: hypothetical protein [unclassified Vibrio]|uniref:hypothetical protein n=1 Tax=unclassified Vibrio TaxID=2614977 RepID=UPI000B8E403B|nr:MULTISPECIES: hypothetical protein [unclassified Vibrio]NAX44832.1 hypothetical protein [Vibrio sp. V25_P4S6T154]OXX59167.1 hypothetical protein B9J89_19480 [Vibrio sp. V15_P4S5T153]